MRKVQIITDSCADLNPEQLQKYGIAFAKMSTSCDGVESVASLTWTESEAHEHYNRMRDGKRIHTAQVSSAEFGRIFEEYLKRDMDIVYIGCSSKQSGSVNTGYVTAKRLMAEYEGSTILCIDSLNAGMGEGMLAIEAAKMAADGAAASEIEARILARRGFSACGGLYGHILYAGSRFPHSIRIQGREGLSRLPLHHVRHGLARGTDRDGDHGGSAFDHEIYVAVHYGGDAPLPDPADPLRRVGSRHSDGRRLRPVHGGQAQGKLQASRKRNRVQILSQGKKEERLILGRGGCDGTPVYFFYFS